MTIVLESEKSFFLASQAFILDEDNCDKAWAERYIRHSPNVKWILGKYVEADRANSNNQFWSLKDLQFGQPSVSHAPMNLLHQQRRIVGAYVASEMMYPIDSAEESFTNPYLEALGIFWKFYFPQEYNIIERAHQEGQLFFSMETVAKSVTCAGDDGCGKEFDYAGPRSLTYCAHLNDGESIKQLNEPEFVGGALLVPPVKPGWRNADVHTLVAQHAEECEKAYAGVQEMIPDAKPEAWESIMGQLVSMAHDSK